MTDAEKIAAIAKKVKVALRISTTDQNLLGEIDDIVTEAFEDMTRAGVTVNYDDPLQLQAVVAFAKAHYGYDDNSDQWLARYKQILVDLCLRSAYGSE